MYRYKKAGKQKLKNACLIFVIIVLTAVSSIFFYIMYEGIQINTYQTQGVEAQKTAYTTEELKNQGKQIVDIVEDVTSCVVGISKIKNAGSTIFLKDGTSSLGLGTGVIVSEKGYVVTNEHVTGAKYSNCYVTLENGRTYTANVVWSDSTLDLSISKISVKNLPYATLGDSDNIKVGENVYAIGNPIGYEFRRTVTSGIISAKNRTIKIEEEEKSSYMTNLIQTDATINPGNSGGPLIYPNGDIIGINTVKISTAEGIGFAIPINIVKPIIDSLKNNGNFEEATIGIYAYDKEVIPYINSSFNINLEKGIYVVQITKNSAAYNTELKEGDIITSIDSIELNTMNDLREYIYTKKPNDEVNLKIIRGKINKEFNIVLGKK